MANNNILNNQYQQIDQNQPSRQKRSKKKSFVSLLLWFGAHKGITVAITATAFIGVTLGTLGGAGVFNGGTTALSPLKFIAKQISTISYSTNGVTDIDIQVSRDNGGNWQNWTGDIITLNSGDSICVKNNTNTLSKNTSNYFQFIMSGRISASGNVNSMINYGILTDYCYQSMFVNCSALITPPKLPATKLAPYCYQNMFSSCMGLTVPPALPATTLSQGCYTNMFSYCGLTFAPELPAKLLAPNCYYGMFSWCTSLKIKQDSGEHKIFTCPNTSTVSSPVDYMFDFTAGTYASTPTSGHTYYWY